MRVFLLLVLLLPQLATARVYMCVDEVTGKTSFTDRGCTAAAARQEVKIPPANANSGRRYADEKPTPEKTWVSDRDARKTGRDYTAEKRELAKISPAPGTRADVASNGI